MKIREVIYCGGCMSSGNAIARVQFLKKQIKKAPWRYRSSVIVEIDESEYDEYVEIYYMREESKREEEERLKQEELKKKFSKERKVSCDELKEKLVSKFGAGLLKIIVIDSQGVELLSSSESYFYIDDVVDATGTASKVKIIFGGITLRCLAAEKSFNTTSFVAGADITIDLLPVMAEILREL